MEKTYQNSKRAKYFLQLQMSNGHLMSTSGDRIQLFPYAAAPPPPPKESAWHLMIVQANIKAWIGLLLKGKPREWRGKK